MAADSPPSAPARSDDGITVVYDGECPVCTAYSCNVQTGKPTELLNARQGGALVDELTAMGLDLDDGMVVIHDGKYYHGADALHQMALHGHKGGLFNRLNRLIFRSRTRSRLLYPALRAGRGLLLKLLGRRKIRDTRGLAGAAKR